MNKIKNTQKINKITMKPVAYTKCAIGQDWYKNELEIVFVPALYYPDYIEVNEWIMENIDGKELNIEDVNDHIYKFLTEEYHPQSLTIKNSIVGCKTHFDVIVEK